MILFGPPFSAPQHGTLVSFDAATGAYVYQPAAGFTGTDSMTYSVVQGGISGGYSTVFFVVEGASLTLPIGSYAPGDPAAQIPSSQFPSDAQDDPQYAQVIAYDPLATVGSTITVSISDDVMQDLDVYDGLPGQSGSEVVMGKDAGTDTFTWTVTGTPSDPTLYAVGLAGTDYDQAVFTASINMAPTIEGLAPDNSPDATTQPANQPLTATQPTTVPGKQGRLEALDGTQDLARDDTNVFLLSSRHYQGSVDYVRGVGNRKDHMHLLGRMFLLDLGDAEALKLEREAMDNVQTFYNQDVTHQDIPLDVIGYSRGAMEAVKLVNDLSSIGVPNIFKPKQTINGKAQFTPFYPAVRFVGLISPVMGPNEVAGVWPRSLPAGVGYLYEALDNFPLDPFLPQHTITKAAKTSGPAPQTFQLGHIDIGHDPGVLATLIAEARAAGAPVS
jgi:hypothetical protein